MTLSPGQFPPEGFRAEQGWQHVDQGENYHEYSAPVSDVKKARGHGIYKSVRDLDELTESVRREGIRRPITLNTRIGVVDGHHRLEAASRAGLTHVPVRIYGSHKDEDEASTQDTRSASDFYTSSRRAREEHERGEAIINSPEYKRSVNMRRFHAKEKQYDFLTGAAQRLHREGNHPLAEEAEFEARAVHRPGF